VQWRSGGGWQEALVGVDDVDRWSGWLADVAGWRVLHRGQAGPSLAAAWGLHAGLRIDEAIVSRAADSPTWLRLLAIEGAARRPVRASAQAWDTGGVFSLLTRTGDLEGSYGRAIARGWLAFNEPQLMAFEQHRNLNVVLRAPFGIHFGLYEPQAPDARAALCDHGLEAPFNAQQMVRDIGPARDFFVAVLGWQAWYDGSVSLACNQFGMPENHVGMPKDVVLMRHGAAGGEVELVHWSGFTGRDLAARAVPTALGHAGLRWAVGDAAPILERAARRGLAVRGPVNVELAPFGAARLSAVTSPDGVVFELVEPH
jgi:catechol 2,3-dioxygenase-like lactoylglutathione lyase family enzyme